MYSMAVYRRTPEASSSGQCVASIGSGYSAFKPWRWFITNPNRAVKGVSLEQTKAAIL